MWILAGVVGYFLGVISGVLILALFVSSKEKCYYGEHLNVPYEIEPKEPLDEWIPKNQDQQSFF